ncbi:hypothetical protein F2Q70_00020270 [Brassica cretica]|uniref:Uncharacterized protein n=1 Tax=Brassica cretica TaxID=69181 RepID=A0A8S9GHL0_BRACR|nr:hypothetical protein F2Q70_00020270 [Brassica cretica]
MAATKMVFHHMVLIFHSCKGFSDIDLDMHVFQIWKTSGLEDFQMTSRKSSRRLPESLMTESFPMSPFHNRSERFDLGLIYIFFRSRSDFGRSMGSLLKYNALEYFQEVFQKTSKKSSRRLQRSLPDDFKEVFNQMVLIFHLDISGSDFGRSMGSLLRRFVKYNALDDFLQTTSKKSSRRLQGSLPDDF